MKRNALVEYLNRYLEIDKSSDYSDNGLQVEGVDEVLRFAVAVDTNMETIKGAIESGAQFLIVHHGLFWGKPVLLVGPHMRRVRRLLTAGCSLYASHLPLDRHPEVGNNAQLAKLLDLSIDGPLGEAFGAPVGVTAMAPAGLTFLQLAERLNQVLKQQPLVQSGGPELVRKVGIISGGGAREIAGVVAAGCDTYITGETSHAAFHDAVEYGINVLYGGHYATETVGVLALAADIQRQFGMPWTFIDRPTGL